MNKDKCWTTAWLQKHKAQENETPQASMPTDPTPTPIIYKYNQANEYFQKNFIDGPFGYACDIW
jgi:hypothetical protein